MTDRVPTGNPDEAPRPPGQRDGRDHNMQPGVSRVVANQAKQHRVAGIQDPVILECLEGVTHGGGTTFNRVNLKRAFRARFSAHRPEQVFVHDLFVMHEHAIRPMQQFDYTKGKNASDMAMVIDALDLLYTDSPDAFGIVSSDADFTPLVMHLRAKGAAVYGFGDSYADIGNLFRITHTFSPVYPTGRFSGGTKF